MNRSMGPGCMHYAVSLLHCRGSRGGRRITRAIQVLTLQEDGRGQPALKRYTPSQEAHITTQRRPTPPYSSAVLDNGTMRHAAVVTSRPRTLVNIPLKVNDSRGPNHEINADKLTDQQKLSGGFTNAPALYVINPTSLAKPHALQQLHADLIASSIDVAIVPETWLKAHHSNNLYSLNGYSLFHHDRKKSWAEVWLCTLISMLQLYKLLAFLYRLTMMTQSTLNLFGLPLFWMGLILLLVLYTTHQSQNI